MSSLSDLKAAGAVVDGGLIEREIRFTLDEVEHTATIHIKRLAIGDYEQLNTEIKESRSKIAHMIATAVRLGENGDEVITFEDAYRFRVELADAIAEAFEAVNGKKKA